MNEALIQAQLDAYNAHDLTALLACYAPDAEQWQFPSTLLRKGREAIAARMQERFVDPRLKAHLINRISMGNLVIDHERIDSSTGSTELIAMYEIENNLIQKQWVKFQ